MSGPVPNEEGLRALGRDVAGSRTRRPPRPDPTTQAQRPTPDALEGLERLGRQHPAGSGRGASGPRTGGGNGSSNGRGNGRGGNHGGGRRPPVSKRRRRLKRTLLVAALVVVLLAAGGAGYAYYLANKVHRVTVHGLTSGPTSGADAGTTNILLVGSTTRCGLKKQTPAFGLCTQTVNGVNSDVIMILHLNPATKSVRLLSIPRDLFIPNSRKTGTGNGAYKIANSLYQGPSQLVAAIEEDFGIPIQHYVELNFDTFAAVLTALGGVTMDFPEPVHDAYSGLNVLVPGCHHLSGFQALQVVRARHLQYKAPTVSATTPATWPYETQSDLARIRRDHEFLRVLASKVSHRGLSNPASDLSLIGALAPNLTVDSGMSASYMASLALTFHGVSFNTAPQWTLPVEVGTFGTYQYRGFPKGTVEFPSEPQDQSIVNQFLGINNDTNSMSGQRLPNPRSVTVSVLNGTGAATQATDTAQALGRLGFKTVGVGTSAPVGTEAETLVTYAQRTPADEAAAQLVARSLSGSVILAYGQTADGADVTVTTGTSFTVDASAPGGAATASGGGSGSSTSSSASVTPPTATSTTSGGTGTTTAGTTSNFAPPTSASNVLKPWDPRACPAGATGNSTGWGS